MSVATRCERGKHIKKSPSNQRNIDEDINLQKARGWKQKLRKMDVYPNWRVNGSWFEVKMYEKGQTMEEISEGWVEVMTTDENEPKELNF